MPAKQSYQSLTDVFRRLNHLDHAVIVLTWDQMVMMPRGGIDSRLEAIADLSVMRHDLISSSAVRDALADCMSEISTLTPGEQRSVLEMQNSYRDEKYVPADLVKAKVIAGARCEHAWRTQREANDWDGFLTNFREVVALSREEAEVRQAITAAATPYDALLDLHCRGDTSELIDRVFCELKNALPPMIEAAIEHQARWRSRDSAANDPLAGAHFPIAAQKALSHDLMQTLGFDFEAGRLDVSAHPFSTGVRGDQRITTRYESDEFLDALLATAHETGHAAYDSGLPAAWSGLPVGEARNMCIHESQSLMFEKMVSLSKPFLEHLLPLVQRRLSATATMSLEDLRRRCRQVSKSLIRVQADELTYPIQTDTLNQMIYLKPGMRACYAGLVFLRKVITATVVCRTFTGQTALLVTSPRTLWGL